ncbi:MAG: glycoside hydrolase family 127 protein [Melioribacter sp.]|uniref:glycoside hydrolase family 127 protein n=1 Tax=Rosettibacter primus TaxID=3111523 RepID=UPI00247D22F9|nr:glycoside hydrolase family 127 protein [Melioribacter sp.]
MKKLLSLFVISTSLIFSQDYSKYLHYPILPVNIKNIVLHDNFWLPKIRVIQDTTIKYAFDKCDKEGRIENFLVAGGKKKGTYKGKMPFDDTDLYKIIEGASYSLMNKYDKDLDAYLDSIIAIIKVGQEEDGYITTWFTINREKPPAWWVKPSKTRWENEISSHELYNSGHLFEAAAAHYWATGKRNFLDIAIKNANLLVDNFGPGKLRTPPGHQIVETGLIKLYQITRDAKYLQLAKFFLDIRGDSTTHKLYGDYSQDHLPVTKQTEAVGHAVRALYMYAGMTDIAVMYNDTDYLNAVKKIWENIINKKMYITGGLGSRHEGESFGKDYELPNLTAYNETCAAIASVYWNHRLFLLTGESKFYDIIERTLYNGLIAGISLDGKNFFYPNPLESDGKFEFNMGSCTRQPWFDCSCCPTNLIRFIPSIPELIYAKHNDSLYINLFVASSVQLLINGKKINLDQQTNYPWDENISIFVNPDEEQTFTLKIRLPGWALNKPLPGDLYSYLNVFSNGIKMKINGKEEDIKLNKGYIEISKKWHKGDNIELNLPMMVRKVIANEKVKDDSNKVAFEYGPIVYCAEEIDNKNIDEIYIPSNLIFYKEDMNISGEKFISLKTKIDESEIKLIPYYVWSNRGIGKMKVWFDRK